MTKFVDENNKLKMTRLRAIYRIAVFAIAFSSMIYIVSMKNTNIFISVFS